MLYMSIKQQKRTIVKNTSYTGMRCREKSGRLQEVFQSLEYDINH
jgi:hypothetical protein